MIVIPSEAEGSAVLQARPGYVFSRKQSSFEARRACPELVEGADRTANSPTLSERRRRATLSPQPASVPRTRSPHSNRSSLIGPGCRFCHPPPLDLLLLFPYIGVHACPVFPQVLRSVLQEMRPRRVSRNRRLPCQRHIRGLFAVWREAAVSALRSDPWPAAFRPPEKQGRGCGQAWTRSRLPRLAPRRKSFRRPGPLSATSAKAPA